MFEEKDPLGILAKDPLGILKKKEDTPLESSAGPSPLPENKELERLKRQLTEGFIKPQRTELPQQLQQSKQIAEFQTQQEASLPKQVKVNGEFKTVYPEQQELTAKVLGFQSAQQLINAQENIKKARKEDEQKAADELYKTSTGKLYFNVIQPMANAASRNIGNVGASIARTLGSDNIADALVDNFTPEKRYEGTIAGSTPTKLQGGLFNNGKMDIAKLPSTVVRGLTDMAYLLAPVGGITKAGQAVGLTEKAAQSAAIFGSSYLQSREGYYQEGKNAGLKGDQLDTYATGAAALTSALESLFPNDIALGNFKKKMAGEYAKQIAKGITSKDALKAGVKEFFKESFVKEPTQEVLQLAGDKIARTLSDMSTGEDKFGNQFDWQKSKDELYETLVITPIISGLAASGGVMQNYKPSNYEKALYYDASKNADKVNEALNRQLESGVLNEEQYNKAKERFSKYNSAVNQVKNLGYSDDQSLQMAWELFSGKEKLPVNQAITADPILKEALGSEVKKDEQSIADNIKQIGMGVSSVGSEIDGKEVSHIISNIGDKGTAISQQLVDNIGDDSYRVEEINVKELYNNNPEFKSYVDSYQKKNTDSDGLLVPAVMKDGQIVDGRSRLAEQYLAGNENVKVFKNISNAINESQGQGPAEGNSLQPARIEAGQQIEGQTTQQETNAGDSNIGSQRSIVTVAPFYATKVKSVEEARALRQSPEYIKYKESIPSIAAKFGLEVEGIKDTIGGFTNAQDDKITEVSNRIFVKGSLEAAEEFGAVLGTLTPETQEATIAAKYVTEDEIPNVPQDEYVEELNIKVGNIDEAIKSLNEAGIYDFTIDDEDNVVSLLDFSKGTDVDFDNKIANFVLSLKNKNISYDKDSRRPVHSKYTSPERRSQILAGIEGDATRLQQGGEDFRQLIVQSKEKDQRFNQSPLEQELRQELGFDTELNDAIDKATQSLSKAGIKFQVIDNKSGQARGNQAIFQSEEGIIYINKDKLNDAIEAGLVVWHEASHPVMNIIRNTNKPLYDAVVRGMQEAAKTNQDIADALQWAQDNYTGEDVQNDEAIVEIIGRINAGMIDIDSVPTSLKQKLIDFINAIAKIFGIDIKGEDIAEFKNTVKQVADYLATGRDIAGIVGEENVKRFENDTEQARIQDNNPVFFENAKEFANKSSFANKVAFKEAIQNIFNKYLPELKKVYGRKFNPSEYNETTKKYLSDVLTKEAFNAIESHPEAIGWYDEKTQSALAAISTIHPEIATDMEARGAFILPLAVMSNGNKVDKNFELAEQQYNTFKKTGRFNPEGDFGAQQAGIRKSLRLINGLLDNGVTMKELNDFLTSKHKAGDLKYRKKDGKLGDLVSGELSGEDVFGAVILGPKIGNGFYMNLWGEFGQLTMDRWFMRTWGRLTGTLINRDKELISNGKLRVNEAIKNIKSDKEALSILKSIIGPISGLSVSDIANKIEKVSAKKNLRNELSLNSKTDELRKAGNGLAKLLRGEKEAPSTGEERKFIREVFSDVQGRLEGEYGIDITMADLQAVLWYPEKILYESFKEGESFEDASEGYTEDSAPDYFNAAKKLALKSGATNEQINQAVSAGRRDSAERTGGRDTGTGETTSSDNQEVLKRIRTIQGGEPELVKKGRRVQASVGNRFEKLEEAYNSFDVYLEVPTTDQDPNEKRAIRRKSKKALIILKSFLGFDIGNLNNITPEQNIKRDAFYKIRRLIRSQYENFDELKEAYKEDKLNGIESDLVKAIDLLIEEPGKTSSNIQFSVGNREIINGFYSPIEDRINTFKQPKASVQKWKEIVGVKSDEAVFSGLADWLGGKKPDQQLSKEEVLKFMKDNRIEIKEVVKGKGGTMSQEQMDDVYNGVREQLAQMDMIDDVDEVKNNPLDVWYNNPTDDNYDALGDFLDERNIDLNFIAEADNDGTKFSQYQLPGGENYKEVLITLPQKNNADRYVTKKIGNKYYPVETTTNFPSGDGFDNMQQAIDSTKELNKFWGSKNKVTEPAKFKSSHFDEPNIITHLRMNTRTDADGKKVLFLEEVQSDWGQQGKREGFKGDEKLQDELKKEGYTFSPNRGGKLFDIKTGKEVTEWAVSEKASNIYYKLKNSEIPSAPYVTNTNAWVKLGLKVALKEAVRQGADRIAWTTGEQQNERYDLSKQVDEITYSKYNDGTYQFSGSKNDVQLFNYQRIPKDKIEDYVGKDVAKRMIDNEGEVLSYGNKEENTYNELGRVLKGSNLTVGGKGMKAFYGDVNNPGIVGNVAKALVKELTGKNADIVESNIDTSAPISKQEFRVENDPNQPMGRTWLVLDSENGVRARETNKADAMNAMRELTNKSKDAQVKGQKIQPAIDITPELAEAVGGGLPQFSVGNRVESSQDFKLAAFVMRKKAEGAKDAEIALAIASVTKMAPADIKKLIDDPEGYIKSKFPQYSGSVQQNIINRAKNKNIYKKRPLNKPIDAAFGGLQPRQKEIEAIANKTQEKGLKQWIKSKKDKLFDPAKGMPDFFLVVRDLAAGAKNIEIEKAGKTVKNLQAEAKKIGFNDWETFGKAMTETSGVQRNIPTVNVPTSYNPLTAANTPSIQDVELPMVQSENMKKLPESIIPYVYQMRAQIDALTQDLITNGYVTPEQAVEIQKNIGAYVNRSYRMYTERGYNPSPEVRKAALEFLVKERLAELATDNAGALTYQQVQESAEKYAETAINDILNKKRNPYFGGKEESRNTGILKQRQDIPAPIRKLMGEYEDPGVVFMMTVAKQAALKASSQYLSQLRQFGMGKIFFEENDADRPVGANSKISSEGSESKRPLDGIYTYPEVAEAIEGLDATYNELTNAWMKVVGAVRWGKTVGSIVTQLKNFESNIGFAVMNGLISPSGGKKAMSYWAKQITNKDIDALTEKVIRLNLVGQSVGARELTSMLRGNNLETIALDMALNPSTKFSLSKIANKAYNFSNKLYRLGDDFWKVYAYIAERGQLAEARYNEKYENLGEAEQNKIDVEASERVKNTWPTYDRVWEGAKYISKNAPIFGNFISFQAESIRVLLNTVEMAKNDLMDPQLRGLGAKRMAGIVSYVALRTAIIAGLASFTKIGASGLVGLLRGDDDEDKRKKAMKSAVPPFFRSHDLLYWQNKKEPWKYTVYSLSSVDPYNILPNSINAFTDGRDGMFKEGGAAAAGAELASRFLEPEMTFMTAFEVATNHDSRTGDKIYLDSDPANKAFYKVAAHVWGTLEPSTVSLFKRLYERDNKSAEISAAFGARPYEVDLHKSFQRNLSKMQINFEEISKEYNKVKYGNKYGKQYTPEEIQQAEELAEMKKNYEIIKMHEMYKNYILSGADAKALDEIIKQKSAIKTTGFDKITKKGIKTGDIDTKRLYK